MRVTLADYFCACNQLSPVDLCLLLDNDLTYLPKRIDNAQSFDEWEYYMKEWLMARLISISLRTRVV